MSLLVLVAFLTVSDVMALGLTSRRGDDASLQSLMTLVQRQAASLQQQDARIEALQNQVSSLQSSVGANVSLLQSAVSKNSAALSTVDSQMRTQVFFTAHMADNIKTITVGLTSPFIFDTIINNVGGGYSPATGVFTAPVDGVYVLYVQLMKHADTYTIHYEIAAKLGTILCRNALDENHYDKSSCLATTRLVKGDQVYVRRTTSHGATGSTLEGMWWCSFSGFLISRDH